MPSLTAPGALLLALFAASPPPEDLRRHPVDKAFLLGREKAAARVLPHARAAALRDLTHASALRSNAEARAAYLMVLEPASPEVCPLLRLGAQASAALFAGAMSNAPRVTVRLGPGPAVSVPARVGSDLHNARQWRRGFFLAAASRDRDSLDVLARVPTALLRRSTTRADEFVFAFADALRAHRAGDAEAPARLLAALKATEPGRYEIAGGDYVLDIAVFQMELLYQLLREDAGAFNAVLARAVRGHRRYWSAGDRAADPDGLVAWPLVALASMAHDAGMRIEVDSDYVPLDLVRGRCRP